jgi:3-hydroxybutyryl-CoA dehydrogenase
MGGGVTEIRRVAVVGCGLMGSGIAEVCARAGYDTLVREVSDEVLERGIGRIQQSMARAVERGKLAAAERDATLGRLRGTTSFEELGDRDLVIEAVIEQLEDKRRVFEALDRAAPEHAILASNTSSIPIIQLATATRRPDRVLGMHFMNPVPVMRLVEFVQALTTSEQTLETARGFAQTLGKRVIVAKDRAGFIVNLLLVPYLLAAVQMAEQGFASREDIDIGMKLGTNMPMGPLELLDYVGLDTAYYIAEILFDEYKLQQYAPPPLLTQMVRAGWHGRKSGRGFYHYAAGEQPPS